MTKIIVMTKKMAVTRMRMLTATMKMIMMIMMVISTLIVRRRMKIMISAQDEEPISSYMLGKYD